MLQRTGVEPTMEELAEQAGMPSAEVRRVMKISRTPVSLDRPVGESEDSYFGDFIEDEGTPRPADSASQEMLRQRIEHVLRTLTYREREILKLRYGIGDGYTYTLEEVGRIFKVTRERVRQVEAKAIRKLQHPVRARKLQGFVDGPVELPPRGAITDRHDPRPGRRGGGGIGAGTGVGGPERGAVHQSAADAGEQVGDEFLAPGPEMPGSGLPGSADWVGEDGAGASGGAFDAGDGFGPEGPGDDDGDEGPLA
jgi:DNA-binding CsgD family transcriptional regulator